MILAVCCSTDFLIIGNGLLMCDMYHCCDMDVSITRCLLLSQDVSFTPYFIKSKTLTYSIYDNDCHLHCNQNVVSTMLTMVNTAFFNDNVEEW